MRTLARTALLVTAATAAVLPLTSPAQAGTVTARATTRVTAPATATSTAAPTFSTRTITTFAEDEEPESVTYRDGAAYATLTLKGQVARVDLATKAVTTYAQLPVAPSDFTLGLAFDRGGALYVAVAAPDTTDAPAVAVAGIWRVPPGGGTPTRWAWGKPFTYPSGLAFDPRGSLYVSDALNGTLYRFGRRGAPGDATPWTASPLFGPDASACPTPTFFPLGLNGIVADRDAVWGVNTAQGTLLHVGVGRRGDAGATRVVRQDCDQLKGADGMRRDPRDPRAFLIANDNADGIVSVTRDGRVRTVADGPAFDTPTDLESIPGTPDVLVINGAFRELLTGLTPHPALLALDLRALRPTAGAR